MDAIRTYLTQDWTALVIPLGILASILFAGWVLKRLVLRKLHRWAAATEARIDDLLVQAIEKPFMIWVLILALYVALDASALPRRATVMIDKWILVLWVVSIGAMVAGLAGNLIRHYGGKIEGAFPVTTLTENLAKLSVWIVTVLILLYILGLSIAPILTALGVGGLAVALALQDTLANLFAGFYVSVAGQIRVGDYIKLQSGEEGYVNDIAWRSTTIRATQNNLIIVPNAKLAQAIVTNYHLPEKRMSLSITFGVSYDSDPDEVERILVDEATKGAQSIPGLLADPPSFVRFIPGFGDSSMDFTLVCQVAEFADQYPAQHELRKRILRCFREAGIEIPFPVRTVYLRERATPARNPRGENA